MLVSVFSPILYDGRGIRVILRKPARSIVCHIYSRDAQLGYLSNREEDGALDLTPSNSYGSCRFPLSQQEMRAPSSAEVCLTVCHGAELRE